jgi:protein phosphatase
MTDTEEIAGPSGDWIPDTLSSLVEVDLGGLSHPGLVRPNNQDQFFVARYERTMRAVLTNLPSGMYPAASTETGYGMLVADGMGGHAAGEVASRTAVSVLVDLVLRTPDWIMRLDDQWVEAAHRRAGERFREIQDALTERAGGDPSLSRMGTTLTLAWSIGADLLLAHVGDSRAYLFHDGVLRQLTRDQTLVQEMIDAGVLSPEEAAQHRLRNVLTGALSAGETKIRVQYGRARLADGDQVLLCSDGLTKMVDEGKMVEVLRQSASAADACRVLVEQALEAGGTDNVTVVVARYRIPQSALNESK